MYKGKMYTVACSTLGAPATKVGSYRVANEWWRLKRAEIDGASPPAPARHPHDHVLDELGRRLDWARSHGDAGAARVIRQSMEELRDDREGGITLAEWSLGGDSTRAVWDDRLSRSSTSSPSRDRTVAAQVARWVGLQSARAAAGEIVPAEAENRRHALAYFEKWIGPDLAVDTIAEPRWTDFYGHLLGLVAEGKRSRSYCEKLLRYARQFIDWLDSESLVSAPRNLSKLRIKQQVRAVETMPIHDARKLITAASGPLNLHLLLMANCGFTQQDISDLRPCEFKDGCIVRKRSRTRDHANVPEVRYKLWPETLALLERYRSGHPEHLLVTKSGQAWVHKEFRGGKFIETDSVRALYSRHARNLKITMSLKHLRKTSATLIDQEPRFGDRIATLFLGHSPRSIKDRHYTRAAEDVLDEAVMWLRGRYFPETNPAEDEVGGESPP